MPGSNRNQGGNRPQSNRGGQGRGGQDRDQRQNLPEYIPSPYNFVPLAKHIFFPEWRDQVSHDVPFSDGISGTITVKITAKTPIYVRNGGNWPEEDRNKATGYDSFFQIMAGKYGIPSTSFKGMIRAIIEIASFGKMNRVSEHRYSIRDLNFPKYRDKMTIGNQRDGFKSLVKAGWLKANGDKWELYPCEYARIEADDLEEYYEKNTGNQISLGREKESAVDKYSDWGNFTLKVYCDIGDISAHHHSRGLTLLYRKATRLGSGSEIGTIVFTGQPTPRTGQPGRKHLEFIFFDETPNPFDVTNLKTDFEFIHSKDEKGTPNDEWECWKRELESGRDVAVFYLADSQGKPQSMGLAMMFRLPYKCSIFETIKHTCKEYIDSIRHDLAETMFGYTNETEALRGRVQISHFMAKCEPEPMTQEKTVLGSPKPTYYPNYICQEEINGMIQTKEHKTMMDDNAEIRGWKRYPVRKDSYSPKTPPIPEKNGKGNEKIATVFSPLPAGTTFEGKIRVHNLRPAELGALIWALTWGGDTNLRHSVGMAKPYGYGSIQIAVVSHDLQDVYEKQADPTQAQTQFKNMMEEFCAGKQIPGKWANSDQIVQLLAMANPIDVDNPNQKPRHELRYPKLDEKEFSGFKQAKKALVKFK